MGAVRRPAPDDDEYCGSVPTNPVTGYAVDDKTVMDEVLRTIREGVGPAKRRPDFTFVNLPQVDSAGHASAPGPAPTTPPIGQADDEIERLVTSCATAASGTRTVADPALRPLDGHHAAPRPR